MAIEVEKAQPYMKLCSCLAMACLPPAVTAVLTISSTSALLPHDNANSPSVSFAVLQFADA